MTDQQVENTPELKIEQAPQQKIDSEEQKPQIKTEENQANWRAFREQRERERKEKEEAQRRLQEEAQRAEALKAALEALTNKPQQQYQQDQQEETEEQRIDRRVREIIAEREAQAEKLRQEREAQEAPRKLQQTYPDFSKVCTTENLDYIDYHYPEIARMISKLPDGFDKWVDMYHAVKKFVPNLDAKKDMAKADKNLQKPGSISSTGTTQGTGAMQSNRLSEERKAANWERMQRSLKGLS